MGQLHSLAAAIEIGPGVLGGQTFIGSFTWPLNKFFIIPGRSAGIFIIDTLVGFPDGRSWGLNASLIGDAYLNFGLGGVVIVMLLFGALLKVLYLKFRQGSVHGAIYSLALLSSLQAFWLSIEVWPQALTTLAFALFSYLHRQDRLPSAFRMSAVAIAFHAERLHDDQTWRRVERFARWMDRRNIRATFFVYPFRAQVAGMDITHRVRAVAALGHEIGQHTHFYAGTKIDHGEKINDLSAENIINCLNRDFNTLAEMGFVPTAFTAGAWLVNRIVCDTLVNLGFVYDWSTRFPQSRIVDQSPDHSWLRSPRFHSHGQGGVLCLPTTCSLGEWFKWGRRVKIEARFPYQLIYLHDYDLLSFRNRLLLSCFLNICSRHTFMPLATIAQEYQKSETQPLEML